MQDIAYLGDLSIYRIRLDTGKIVKVTMPNQLRSAELRLTWEDRVHLSWHPTSGVVLMS